MAVIWDPIMLIMMSLSQRKKNGAPVLLTPYSRLAHTLKTASFHCYIEKCLILKSTLTRWGRVTHICVSKLTIIGSDNGLSPDRRQAIIWTNAGLLLIGPLGTNFSEILINILTFSFKKMRLKVSSAKRRPFCVGLNVLKVIYFPGKVLENKSFYLECFNYVDQESGCMKFLDGQVQVYKVVWSVTNCTANIVGLLHNDMVI